MSENSRNKTVSIDVRKIILRMINEEGKSQREVSRLLRIPRTTIQGILSLYGRTNSIVPQR